MNIYEKLGISKVINAAGRMTKLGVSCIQDEVKKAMNEGAQSYVVMDEWMEAAGKRIAECIGCEDVCVTSSASSGISLAVASLLCGNNLQKVQHFYQTVQAANRREVILLKGHNVDFGAPIDLLLEMGGATVIEVGYANASTIEDISNAVNENTLAIVYVKSHHCVQKNMVNAKQVIELANDLDIPCIIDAAAEEDLSLYHQMGADFVCYSGAKAISGPTSGFVACRHKEDASNMRLQYRGIGRAMKVGKENIAGLVRAIEIYTEHNGYQMVITMEDLANFMEQIQQIEGLKASLIKDEAGRDIVRCRLQVEPSYGKTALELAQALKTYKTPIYTREYRANEGYLDFDPRPLVDKGDLNTILEALHELKEG